MEDYIISQTSTIDNFKVSEADVESKGVQSISGTKMTGTADQNKAKFDELATYVAQQLNGLIKLLKSKYGSKFIGADTTENGETTVATALDALNANVNTKVAAALASSTALSEAIADILSTNATVQAAVEAAVADADIVTSAAILAVTLADYNTSNPIASFSSLVTTDTIATALEKLCAGIKKIIGDENDNENTVYTPAKIAQDFDTSSGTIKTRLEAIADAVTSGGVTEYVAKTAKDYTASGGIGEKFAAVDASLAGKQATLTFDNTPTSGSNNPVKSGGVYTALAGKQSTLTFDNAPTADSNNPVKSSGIKTALDAKQGTLTFDTTPTASSTNPVTSGGVKTALDAKQATLTFDTTPTANSTKPVTSGGIKTALDAKVSVPTQVSGTSGALTLSTGSYYVVRFVVGTGIETSLLLYVGGVYSYSALAYYSGTYYQLYSEGGVITLKTGLGGSQQSDTSKTLYAKKLF